MSFSLEQGVIMSYADKAQRLVNVMQIPEHYMLSNVRLPQVLKDQTLPAVGSLVIMARADAFRCYIIDVIRESKEFIDDDGFLRASTQDSVQALQPGEVYMESFGDPSSEVPGTGASFYMGNAGTINLTSGQTGEYITIGGSDTDDDHEVIINGANVFLQGTPTALQISSIVQFDNLNNIQMANNLLVGDTLLEQPICELTMDALGTVVLRNTNAGITKSNLTLDVTGEVTLENLTGSINIDPAGNVSISANATMDISSTGALSISGSVVKINDGTLGAARLTDAVISALTQDPAFWNFIQTLFISFNAHTHISAAPGNPTSPPVPLLLTFPTQLMSTINSASGTVLIGD